MQTLHKSLGIFQVWLCIKPGIREQGAECGERGEYGECYIPENVAKHSRECLHIPGECCQKLQEVLPNILENVS